MSEPASKRRRVNSDGSAASANQPIITRPDKFWLDDGNVVLQAEDKQFCVHRSMLARHSTTFEDMFAMPQPAEPQDVIVEGCPVITLSDKADDVQKILSIFYDNVNVLDLGESLPVDQVAAMLRLGKKYDITYLRDQALKRLRRFFPATLEGWDASFADNRDPSLQIDFSSPAEIIETCISLGREHGIPTILPSAFLYYTARVPLGTIVAGDGNTLPLDARLQCVLGRDLLIRRTHSMLKEWANRSIFMHDEICYREDCSASREEVLMCLDEALWLSEDGTLWGLETSIPNPASDVIDILCQPCATSVKMCYNDARREIWKELPGFFNLPDWEQLKDFDT